MRSLSLLATLLITTEAHAQSVDFAWDPNETYSIEEYGFVQKLQYGSKLISSRTNAANQTVMFGLPAAALDQLDDQQKADLTKAADIPTNIRAFAAGPNEQDMGLLTNPDNMLAAKPCLIANSECPDGAILLLEGEALQALPLDDLTQYLVTRQP